MSRLVHFMRLFTKNERVRWFLAGVGLGVLFVVTTLFLIICQT